MGRKRNYSTKIFRIFVSCLVVISLLTVIIFVYKNNIQYKKLDKFQPTITVSRKQLGMPPLYTQGNKILRSDTDKPIILKGVVSDFFRSDYNNGAGYLPVEDELRKLAKLKLYGINVVGLYLSNSPNIKLHIDILDTYINYANNNGLYVYLMPVARSFYNVPNRTYNLSPENYQDLIKLIDLLASRYRDYPNVIYGFGAEPGEEIEDFNSWNKKQIELAELVRKYNPNAPLLITAAPWASEISKYATTPFPFNNVIYQNDGYLAGDEKGAAKSLLNEKLVQANIEARITNSLDSTKYPILIGEFGGYSIGDFSSPGDLTLTQKILDKILKYNLSYTAYRLSPSFPNDPLALFDNKGNLTPKGRLFVNSLNQ